MFCSKCGTQLPNDAKVCPSCGTPVTSGNDINVKDIASFAGNKAKDTLDTIVNKTTEYGSELKQKSQEMQKAMEQQIEQQREQRISNANHAINNMFVDTDECEISTLGGSYLNNFLLTGTLKKGFCTLTDKRVYFRGNCYSRFGNEYRTNREERIVGLKDITGTGFVDIRYWWLKLIFIMSAILSLSFFILNESMPYNQHTTQTTAEFCTFFCCITIISLLSYIFFRKRYFEISYTGGNIAFKASNYTISETQDFQKALHSAKDRSDAMS